MTRALLTTVCLLAVATASGCGGTDDGRKTSTFDPFTDVRVPPADVAAGTRNAAPRWESITTLTGSGAAERPFTVAPRAIQWRARWRCESGQLRLTVVRGSQRRALTDAACPGTGMSAGVRTGQLRLAVSNPAAWQVKLEQQVDTPLHEPPLASMSSPGARLLSRGRFYRLERAGRGTASLYRLATGRLALRIDGGFATSANTDLFVWLSTARRPQNTVQAQRAPHTVLRLLKSTLGEQNYLLPASVKASRVRSIVIWCEPVQIAYTAASLRPL